VQELFTKEQLQDVQVKQVNYTSSCVAFNNGKATFTIKPLPVSIQFSSAKTILATDINKDGFIDLLIGGNEFNFQPQLGRLDASAGDILLNDGKGWFSVSTVSKTGIDFKGQVRDIIQVKQKETNSYLFLQNNEYPVLCEPNKKNTLRKK
jgi:enediyne biosynthesis protein E4